MQLAREIEKRFKENSTEYLRKDFEKHKHYLEKVAFPGNSGLIQPEYIDAIALFATDPVDSVNRLFEAVLPAIEVTMGTVYNRAQGMFRKYQNSGLSVVDNGRAIMVQSDRGNKMYTVNLTDLECDCPYYKKVKFSGMVCKHIFLADMVFGKQKKTKTGKARILFGEEPNMRLNTESTDKSFSYGDQKLTKREKRGNSLIPVGINYILEGKQPEIVIYSLENSETLLLTGESGVGKSKMIHFLAQETNTPLLNACGHNEITVENLLGTMTVVNGNTVWKDGILPEAMRRGYWLLLDEINSIDPGVVKVINELLDNRKITMTVAGEPRLVKAHRNFRFVSTMNPPDSPIYKGIETMSFEFMDRFDTVVHLDYLSPATETELIMDLTGFSDKVAAKKIVQFANTIRQAMKQGEIFATVTTRSLISFCRKAQSFDIRTAAEASILRKMSTADREKASDIFNAIFK